MRFVVLIASHIDVPEKLLTLKCALQSLNGIKKPDHVYISCSFTDYKPDIIEWVSAISDIPYTITMHPMKQLLLIEHYKILSDYVNDTDIVCFLNDKDVYDDKKILYVSDYVSKNPDFFVIKHPVRCFGFFDKQLNCIEENCIDNIKLKSYECTNKGGEICHLVIKGQLFKDWFINCKKYTKQSFEELLNTEEKKMIEFMFLLSITNDLIQNFTEEPLMYIREGPQCILMQ